MNRNQRKTERTPHWLYAETISRGRRNLDREWDELLSDDAMPKDDIMRLSRAMMALRAERPSRPLLAPANARSLRWVNRKLRESRAASRLCAARPDLPLLHRLKLRWLSLSGPVLACLVMLMIHTRLNIAMDQVHRAGQRLAAMHFDRHIGPMA